MERDFRVYKGRVQNLIIASAKVFLCAALSGCLNTADSEIEEPLAAPKFPTAELRVVADNNEIVANGHTTANAFGGEMPYTYRLASGQGSVDPATGVYTPDFSFVGTATIEAVDSSDPEQTASVNVSVLPPLSVTPISKIVFIGDPDVTFNVSGGKPPYTIIQDGLTVTLPDGSPSGASFVKTANSMTITLPSVEDVVFVTAVDSLFNFTTVSLQVLPQLRISTDATLFPSVEADGKTSRPIRVHVRGGKPPYELAVLQGVHDSTKSAIAPVLDENGAEVPGEFVFYPAPFTEQIATPIRVQAKDANNKIVPLSFGVFVPKSISVGGLHSCALNNVGRAGQIKCWGDGIHGQLGYGDDPYAQPYWGDEPAEQSTASDNFKNLELLTASEKAAGGQVIDFDIGFDVLCAVVWTGTLRDVRCFGSSRKLIGDSSSRSGIAVNAVANNASPDLGGNRFPFEYHRHRYIDPFNNSVSTQPLPDTQGTVGYLYRMAVTDSYLATSLLSVIDWFQRLAYANVLPSSGPYQTQSTLMIQFFGSSPSRAPDAPLGQYNSAPAPAFQDPSLMTAYSHLAGTYSWNPDRIALSRFWNYGGNIAIISTTGQLLTGIQTGAPVSQGLLPGGASYVRATATGGGQAGTWCVLGSDQRGYCMNLNSSSNMPEWLGANVSCGTVRTAFGATPVYSAATCPTAVTNYQPIPVTTLIGGDADLMTDITTISGYSFGVACGIFKGTPSGSPSINLVACWGTNVNYLLGNNNGGTQAYAKPVLCATNDGIGCIGGKLQNATKVLLDGTKGCAIASGRLYCWGNQAAISFMIPGYTTGQPRAVPVDFGANNVILELSTWGIDNTEGSACAITQNTITLEKSLNCWGRSSLTGYQLPKAGPGTWSGGIQTYHVESTNPIQVKIGGMVGCLLPSDRKTLRCWGDNRTGLLGIGNGVRGNKPGDMQFLTPVSLGTDSPPSSGNSLVVSQVSSGFEHNCAIVNVKSGMDLSSPRLKCWGSNAFGEMGQSQPAGLQAHKHVGDNRSEMGNNLASISFPGDTNEVRLVASGGDHVCAVTASNSMYCWGDNAVGQLGLRSNNAGCGPSTTAPYSTCSATCGPTSATCSTPQRVNLPTTFTPPGGTTQSTGTIQQIAVGIEHSCALFCSNGTDCRTSGTQNLYCWGSNEHGQLGYGNLSLLTDTTGAPLSGWVNSSLPTAHAQYGHIVRIGKQATDTPISLMPAVDLGLVTNPQLYIKQIAAGGLNTCVLYGHRTVAEFGKLRCFGVNTYGQIGIGTYNTNSYGVNSDMGINLADVGYKHLIDFGTNVNTGAPHYVKQVAIGLDFACAVLDDGFLKCWGHNSKGQLGLQDQQDRGVNAGEMGENLPYVNLEPGTTVLSVSVGALHSCAVLSNNRIKCWGANTSGQLGFDAEYGRGAYPFTMGNSLPYCKASFP